MNFTLPPLDPQLMLFINLVLSCIVAGVSGCRVGRMHQVLWRVRIQYILMLAMALTHGFAPIVTRDTVGWASIGFAAAVAVMLVLDSYQWPDGDAPAAAKATKPAEL